MHFQVHQSEIDNRVVINVFDSQWSKGDEQFTISFPPEKARSLAKDLWNKSHQPEPDLETPFKEEVQ